MSDSESGGQTRRQELVEILAEQEWSFDDLRRELGLAVRLLEDDLRHIERSLRRGPRTLHVTPPTCLSCGFAFRGRDPKRFYTPGRCPKCRNERVRAAVLRVE